MSESQFYPTHADMNDAPDSLTREDILEAKILVLERQLAVLDVDRHTRIEAERALMRIRDSQESDVGVYAEFCVQEAAAVIGEKP